MNFRTRTNSDVPKCFFFLAMLVVLVRSARGDNIEESLLKAERLFVHTSYLVKSRASSIVQVQSSAEDRFLSLK